MLASKQSIPLGIGSSSSTAQLQTARDYAAAAASGSRRTPLSDTTNQTAYASPTESEFSEAFDASESAVAWDEKQVGDWLKGIGCGVYAAIFKENNVNGSNLIECDQTVLKEMGIKKIGDRVRIFVGIKALRSKSLPNQKKRNRDSIAALDRLTTMSPRTNGFRPREQSLGAASKRFSTQIGSASLFSPAYPYPSPKTEGRIGQPSYFTPSDSGLRPDTPSEASSKGSVPNKRVDSMMSKTPGSKDVIRVIYGDQTKKLDITGWKGYEDVMNTIVRKLSRPDANFRNFCFYVHEPTGEDANNCRRLSEKDLLDVLFSGQSPHRSRLILRTIHSGGPDSNEIEKSHDLAMEENRAEHQNAYLQNFGGLRKLEKIFGERPSDLKTPLSPHVNANKHKPVAGEQRRPLLPATKWPAQTPTLDPSTESPTFTPPVRVDSKRQQQMRKFEGTRPPSELISHDLSSYFTEVETADLQRTVTIAQRRSARMSKAASRVSTASTFSMKDIMKDAPALPSIPTNFLDTDPYAMVGGASGKSARPLSVWRQSVALPSVKEDEANEPNRKSYMSFTSDDGGSKTVIRSSLDDGDSATALDEDATGSTGGQSTLNEQYREALKADGEGPDEELDSFLTGNTFDKMSWMQGDLIGRGSFGSVYLALHAVTGELMAVKQVELPGKAGADAAMEKKKESMLAALKREINLLSELQHEHIVQYLGVQATDDHLNIFLEYVPGGSVASMLNNYGHLQEPLIRNLVRQTLDGLTYLHQRDIIHRDIKGANILVDNKGKVKISDFGISKKVDLQSASGGSGQPGKGANKRVSMQGSVFWMAPEVVKQTSYTRKADIWSLGALIVEMFTGEHPYPKLSQIQALFRLGGQQNQKPDMPEQASPEAKEFLEKTFEIDESARPEAAVLMKLPFMKVMVA